MHPLPRVVVVAPEGQPAPVGGRWGPLLADGTAVWVPGRREDDAAGALSLAAAFRRHTGQLPPDGTALPGLAAAARALTHADQWRGLLAGGDPWWLVLESGTAPAAATVRAEAPALAAWLDARRPGWGFAMLSPHWIEWRAAPPSEEALPGVWVGEMRGWAGAAAYLVSRAGAAAALRMGLPLRTRTDSLIRTMGEAGHAQVYGAVRGRADPPIARADPMLREHFVPLADEPQAHGPLPSSSVATMDGLAFAMGCTTAALAVVVAVLMLVVALTCHGPVV